jgi:hypothetical protein
MIAIAHPPVGILLKLHDTSTDISQFPKSAASILGGSVGRAIVRGVLGGMLRR